MNLHICYDEKVISRAIRYFEEALPAQNRFIVLTTKGGKAACKHVKTDEPYVFYECYGTKNFWKTVGDVGQYRNIIIHFLGNETCSFVLALPEEAPITWILWGADLYNDLLIKRGFHLLANPEDKKPRTIYRKIRRFLFFPLRKALLYYYYRNKIKAIQKIQNIAAGKGDLQLLYKYYPEVKPYRVKKFFYYPVDDIIGDTLKGLSTEGNNIIVGNSASYTNNHRFVFSKLKDMDLGDRDVLVPLSYGDNVDVAMEAGKQLGIHFKPILDFMPLADYNRMLASVSTFVYGNFRQEAVGNILIAFYLGAAVFLYDNNPLYVDLTDAGYIVFPFSLLKEKINYRLTEEEKRHNRDLVEKLNNKELLISYIKESFG